MPEPIEIYLDHKIRTPIMKLPRMVREGVVEALTIPNIEKLNAKEQHQWGWERMSDYIHLYELENEMLVMPRGFMLTFVEGLMLFGLDFKTYDNRQWDEDESLKREVDFKEWQSPAANDLYGMQQGIYKAPAGSGKTVTILGLVGMLGCKSLIIVNTKDIIWQWKKRVATFLGDDYPLGQIGDNKFEVVEGITIATAQTLHSRYDQLEADGFFDEFSLVCLDECHHATANTYNRVLDRFSSRYRIGVSATPDKTGDFALATHVLGPIVHTTRPSQVTNLLKPTVVKVPTKFGFGFRGTKNRWQRSNYGQMIEAIVRDEERNKAIVSAIMSNVGHHQLVVSKRLEHLDILEAMLLEAGFPDPIARITGADKNDDREAAVELAGSTPSLILSTLADEALDIPRLDRLYLVFPQKNPGLVTQQVGRVERMHPDKKDAIIYDFCDLNVGPLEKQWRIRRFEVYEIRGYKITTMKAEDFDGLSHQLRLDG